MKQTHILLRNIDTSRWLRFDYVIAVVMSLLILGGGSVEFIHAVYDRQLFNCLIGDSHCSEAAASWASASALYIAIFAVLREALNRQAAQARGVSQSDGPDPSVFAGGPQHAPSAIALETPEPFERSSFYRGNENDLMDMSFTIIRLGSSPITITVKQKTFDETPKA